MAKISDFEEELSKKIRQGEAPFLGLFRDDFSLALRYALRSYLDKKESPLETFLAGLQRYPASFATYLTIHLMEGFGDEGFFEVYRHLEEAIRAKTTFAQRRKLWRYFRKACLQLGLSVSPRTFGPHFMVDEYLRQAGFPLRYIKELTRRLRRLANSLYVPDEDDPEAITLWQQHLIDHLQSPFSITGREAIERDEQGYYVRCFIKLQTRQAAKGVVVEQLMEQAIQELEIEKPGQIGPKAVLAVPQILFRDGQLGILLPHNQDLEWHVTVDGNKSVIRNQVADHFFIFIEDLPKKVIISRDGLGKDYKFTLWEDEADNRLLLFSQPSGKLQQKASVGEEEVALKPGRFAALLRFEPGNIMHEVLQLSQEPSLFLMEFDLLPGEELRLTRGPASLNLHAEEVPSLTWQGEIFRDVRNNEIYSSKGLFLFMVIPQEFLEVANASYVVTLKPGSLGEDLTIPLDQLNNGKTIINLNHIGTNWKPGVSRLLAELKRQDSQRVLARGSIIWWNGLRSVGKSTLYFDRLPENLEDQTMENVQIEADKNLITYKDDLHRYFKMDFLDGTRSHSFTFSVPGIFLSLEKHGESGGECPLKLGSTLAVTASTRNILKVSTTGLATLRLGEFQIPVDFSRVSSKLLPLASLHEYLGPGVDRLTLRYVGSDIDIDLVRLTSPHEVVTYQAKAQNEGLEITCTLQEDPEEIDLTIENVLTGETLTLDFNRAHIERGLPRDWDAGGSATIYKTGFNTITVTVNSRGFNPGWWMVELKAKIAGKWGPLADSLNRFYVGEIILNSEGRLGVFSDIRGLLSDLTTDELGAILTRHYERLLRRYAPKCQSLISRLEHAWNYILTLSEDHIPPNSLIDCLSIHSELDQESGSLPNYHLGAMVPQIICHLQDYYNSSHSIHSTVLADCLQLFPRLENPTTTLINGLIHSAVVFGFTNAILIQSKGERPRKFNLQQYKNAMIGMESSEDRRFHWNEEWRPGPGDYLGPRHYRRAICKMDETYQNTLHDNDQRIGKLIFFLNQTNPLHLKYGINPIDLGFLETECRLLTETEEVQREALQKMVKFLSLWAYVCRRSARDQDILKRFLTEVKNKMVEPSQFENIFSYLLYVGEEVLAFYLLLWEFVFICDLDK